MPRLILLYLKCIERLIPDMGHPRIVYIHTNLNWHYVCLVSSLPLQQLRLDLALQIVVQGVGSARPIVPRSVSEHIPEEISVVWVGP